MKFQLVFLLVTVIQVPIVGFPGGLEDGIGGETNTSSTNLTTVVKMDAKQDSANERTPLVLPLKMLGHPHEIVELLLKSGKVVLGGVIGEFEAGDKKKSPETNPTTLIKVEDGDERPAQQGFPLKMLGHPHEIIDLIIKNGKPVISDLIGEYEETKSSTPAKQ